MNQVMRRLMLLLTLVSISIPLGVRGDMVSPDSAYHIYADSVDAGGAISTGGVYSLDDTLGESIATTTSGGVYMVRGGYAAMTSSSITMLISSDTVNLGSLDNHSVSTANTIVTITTDDSSGYSLSIGSESGTHLTDVADGTVTAGAEEYGFAAAGGDSKLSGDNPVQVGVVAASSTPAYNSQTTLTFKASINAGSLAGSYSQVITLQASANLGP